MTSYALMALLYQNVTQNLVHANAVVKWLSMQRRSFGSFVSTQVAHYSNCYYYFVILFLESCECFPKPN